MIGENLVLTGVDFPDPLIGCFPLRLVGGGPGGSDVVDGSPVRAVALQLG